MKRKLVSIDDRGAGKRLKVTVAAGQNRRTAKPNQKAKIARDQGSVTSHPTIGTGDLKTGELSVVQEKGDAQTPKEISDSELVKSKRRVNKLVPPRPFPTVPTSVSATGPRSAHKEGKNCICITRKTPLGSYMRRCKDAILKDGYKTLHLSAMGAAIPHLLQLSVALPPILPFAPDEIRTEVLTGTVEVQDEIIPDDEDEDITYQTREKSTLMVVIKIGDGEVEGERKKLPPDTSKRRKGSGSGNTGDRKGKGKINQDKPVVFHEPEQDEMDTAI